METAIRKEKTERRAKARARPKAKERMANGMGMAKGKNNTGPTAEHPSEAMANGMARNGKNAS